MPEVVLGSQKYRIIERVLGKLSQSVAISSMFVCECGKTSGRVQFCHRMNIGLNDRGSKEGIADVTATDRSDQSTCSMEYKTLGRPV